MTTVTGSLAPGQTAFDGLEEIADADILLVSVRRRTPPKEQLEAIRRHVAAGKPVVGIRTASHAFQPWLEFDQTILGGSYGGHHKDRLAQVKVAENAAKHPVLVDVEPFATNGKLYKNPKLAVDARVQDLLRVLPALRMARARRVGVGQLVEQEQRGPAAERFVEVELREGGALVLDRERRQPG